MNCDMNSDNLNNIEYSTDSLLNSGGCKRPAYTQNDSTSIAENHREFKKTKVEEPGIALDDEKLREFQVLDEVQGSCSDDDVSGDGNSENDNSSDLDFDENEIENLLDEALPDDLKNKKKLNQYEQRFKTVLDEKGHNHFEVLPEGWLEVTHNSGIPLYLHKQTRVCSVSKPYFLGPGSVRVNKKKFINILRAAELVKLFCALKHLIPLSSIPCLSYRKALEKEEEDKQKIIESKKQLENDVNESATENIDNTSVEVIPTEHLNGNMQLESIATLNSDENPIQKKLMGQIKSKATPFSSHFSNAQIETVKENLASQSLSAQQINEYCQKLFKFKTIRVMKFKSWSARRKFTKNRKNIKCLQRPTLPDGTKLIKFPVLVPDIEPNTNGQSGTSAPNTTINRQRKEWIMNPNGKSYVCILHEYVQHALKKQPTYEFKELENAATPYSATVSINELQYGTGYGTSKKQAKSEAARETLEILIPEMKDKITSNKQNESANKNNFKDLSVFDDIKITDPRVAEFCNKTTEPSPHAILLTCLQRNFGLGDVQINYAINTTKHKRNEFTMTVGKHAATVVCKNKKEGKQLASQHILQILHPHIKTWGSLLRLYGNNSVKSFKEKKQEEQEITVLQSKAAINQPNYAILEKLKLDMIKLSESRAAVQPIGTIFIPPTDVSISSGSNLKNVEL